MRIGVKLAALAWFLLPTAAVRADVYAWQTLAEVKFTEGTLPDAHVSFGSDADRFLGVPRVVLDGEGEAYCTAQNALFNQGSPHPVAGGLAVRLAKPRDVQGTLFVVTGKRSTRTMTRLRFTLPAAAFTSEERQFVSAKYVYYESLARSGVAGGAWFRHQSRLAAKQLGNEPQPNLSMPVPNGDLDSTYALLSGGRAVSENLQLDRALIGRSTGGEQPEPEVDISTLRGIDVAPIKWDAKIAGAQPKLDPLAEVVPADQHALLFPSFSAAMNVLDDFDRRGTIVLHLAEERSEDARTRQRYERQMGLELSPLARLLGPQLVRSVALTGSDPYLRVGSDVAVLLEANDAGKLKALLEAQIMLVAKPRPPLAPVRGTIAGIDTWSLVSPDRTTSAIVAEIGPALVITNSMKQIELIAAARDSKTTLATAPEYVFFRKRYSRGAADEQGLLVLTDATIRRWCSPRWRIADSRRTRAAAQLSELQAGNLDALARRQAVAGPIEVTDFPAPDLGAYQTTDSGVRSRRYGSLAFMTPIVEMPLAKVTKAEADTYERWRNTYQQNWRNYFDPIAIRLTIDKQRLAADMTVMPLIAGTQYRELIDFTQGARLAADSGDPHDALWHVVLGIDTKSERFRARTGILGAFPMLGKNPLGWLGKSVALYADSDPFWGELAKAPDKNEFMQHQWHRLPVAVNIEVSNRLALAGFLVGLRGLADQSAPGMLVWETLKHNDQPYVKITASEGGGAPGDFRKIAIYYAPTDTALVISLSENVLKGALDRQLARRKARAGNAAKPPAASQARLPNPPAAGATPWLGESVAVQMQSIAWQVMREAMRSEVGNQMQLRAWSNLPILNEWKRLYPNEDSVRLHERVWNVRLVDPAGGTYRWNEQAQTFESSLYGHPAEPKEGPGALLAVQDIARASFGLTFEEDGLRAGMVLKKELRSPGPKR